MLYLECNMGAAGDMLTAALAQLVSDPGGFVSRMNGLGLPGVAVRLESSVKCGIAGAHVSVTVDGEEEGAGGPEHHHAHQCSGMDDIVRIIDGLAVSGKVKSDALAVYKLIAEAESRSHGKPVGSIHFHEGLFS